MTQLQQPVPFEINRSENGLQVASNGQLRVVAMPDVEARLFRRRGLQGLALKPPAEQLIPQLNELAGELLKRPDMPAHEAVSRLLAMAGMVPTREPRRIEWLVAEVGGAKIYIDGVNVIITAKELTP